MTTRAFVNPGAGKASDVRTALDATGGIEVSETEPADLAREITAAIADGAERIVVAGGDGSVAAAAGVLAGTSIVLGIVPAGTLNHLAKDLRIPLDLGEAAALAATTDATTVDVARAGERIFINTSSLGAYVVFVRTRERLEPRLGYWLASLVASMRLLFTLRLFTVELEVEGAKRRYRTPLVFIGVGEREVKLPKLGGRVEGGARGLHVIVVSGRTGARLFALALAAAARGLDSVARGPALDAFLVERCTIELPAHRSRIAVDGEIIEARGTIEYTLWRDALHVAVPQATRLDKASGAA